MRLVEITAKLVHRLVLHLTSLAVLVGLLHPHFKLHHVFKKFREVVGSVREAGSLAGKTTLAALHTPAEGATKL